MQIGFYGLWIGIQTWLLKNCYLIESRIEGEKFVISSYLWSVEMDQEHFDNRDLEMLKFLIWHEGMEQWQD